MNNEIIQWEFVGPCMGPTKWVQATYGALDKQLQGARKQDRSHMQTRLSCACVAAATTYPC